MLFSLFSAFQMNRETYPDRDAGFPVNNPHFVSFSVHNIPREQVPEDLEIIDDLTIHRVSEIQV